MSTTAQAGPHVPARPGRRSVLRAEAFAVAGTRAVLVHPSRVVTIFWAGGGVAVLSVLPLSRWPRHSVVALVVIAGVCGAVCGARVAAGSRLPGWTLHVDVGVATVLASALSWIGVTGHVPFADLYIWVAVFAVLYLRPLAALAHIGAAGGAYGAVLAVGPRVDNPAAAWLALFGTMVVAGVVIFGTLSLLRATTREDVLTGIPNRRSWDERLEEELERSRRTGSALSVVVADIDGLKAVNDAGGHDAGDRLLREVAGAWQAVVRGGGDFLARLGGDEFGLLAPGLEALGVRRLAKRLAGGLPGGVSASIGVATWDRTETASDLVRRADLAMYEGKLRQRRTGRRNA